MRRTFDTFAELDRFFKKTAKAKVQQVFLNTPAEAVIPKARAIIVTCAGFRHAWFRRTEAPGRDFTGRIRGHIQRRLEAKGKYWFRRQALQTSSKPEYLGPGVLARSEYGRCDSHFLRKKAPKGRKNKRSRCGIARPLRIKNARLTAKEPWLIFSSADDFKSVEVINF